MGIQGLLKNLSPLLIPLNELENGKQQRHDDSRNIYNIRQFANKVIAIDASCWLYKAGYSCAERLVECMESKKIDTFCEERICK
jgi:hypothetical protein